MKKFIRLLKWSSSNLDKSNNWNLTIEFLCDPKTYKLAYEKLKSKPGNMTPGITKETETLDEISNVWISKIIKEIRDGTIKIRRIQKKIRTTNNSQS